MANNNPRRPQKNQPKSEGQANNAPQASSTSKSSTSQQPAGSQPSSTPQPSSATQPPSTSQQVSTPQQVSVSPLPSVPTQASPPRRGIRLPAGDRLVALATIFIGIVALILGWPTIQSFFAKPKTVDLPAIVVESGTAYTNSDSLVTLKERNFVGDVGDTADNQQAKLFLTFDLSDVPVGAKISTAYLAIRCEHIVGNPKDLGDLGIVSYRYDYYSKSSFDTNIPIYRGIDDVFFDGWGWDDINAACAKNANLIATRETLKEIIGRSILLDPKIIQFAMGFKNGAITSNKQADIMTLGYPILHVEFKEP